MTCLTLFSALHNPLLHAVGRVQTPTTVALGLSHVGETCRLFLGWERLVSHGARLLALRCPGREARLIHAPFRRMSNFVEQILSTILFLEDVDLYLFSHSIEVLVGHTVCQEVRARGRRAPSGLITSPSRPPWGTPESAPIRIRSDTSLYEELLALGDVPPEVFKNPAAKEFTLSSLWASYELLEIWTSTEGLIDSPIHGVHGGVDALTEDDVDGWRRSTTSGFHSRTVPGGRFYLSDSPTLATHCPTDLIRSRRTTSHQ